MDLARPELLGSLAITVVLMASACASLPRSTRLRDADYQDLVAEMTAALAASDLLAERGPDSPQMRVVTRRVINLSSDVIPEADMWMLVARIQAAAPLQELARHRNLIFQLPPERLELVREHWLDWPALAPEDAPTHILEAIYWSATRSGGTRRDKPSDVRKDYYDLEYRVVDLTSRELVWTASFAFAREATGLVID